MPKPIQIRDFHTLLRIAPPLTGVKFWSPAAFFCFWGPMNTLVNVILLWEIVNLLRNRYVVGQFQRIEEDFVKRLEVSLYYGCARGTRRFWINRIGGFHIVSMRSSRRFFCRSVRELHLAKRVRCSSVSWAGSTSSAKNCAKVMPNALHTASKVGSVGALFRLNIFVTVEWERLASFASR